MDMLRPAVRAFLISIGGAGLAWGWFTGDSATRVALVVLVVVIAVAGIEGQQLGEAALPDHPVRAVRLLEWRFVTVVVLAAVAAAAVIVVTIAIAADEASGETKEVLAALTAAVTTFLTAAFSADEKTDERIGEFIRDRFYAHYARDEGGVRQLRVRYFPAESAGELWVFGEGYQDVTGWGKQARRERAKGVADALAELDPHLDGL